MREALMRTMGAGTMTLPNGSKQAAFVIIDNTFSIKRIGANPSISIRGAVYQADTTVLLVLMFKINDNDLYIYRCCIGYHDKQKQIIDLLCDQDNLVIEFRDNDYKRSKQVMLSNKVKTFARTFRGVAAGLRSHDHQSIGLLQDQLYKRYDTIECLWEALSEAN